MGSREGKRGWLAGSITFNAGWYTGVGGDIRSGPCTDRPCVNRMRNTWLGPFSGLLRQCCTSAHPLGPRRLASKLPTSTNGGCLLSFDPPHCRRRICRPKDLSPRSSRRFLGCCGASTSCNFPCQLAMIPVRLVCTQHLTRRGTGPGHVVGKR